MTTAPVTISLPFMPSSAALARQQLQDWLVGLGAKSEVIEDSRLIVSELVGNAVRHATPLADGTMEVAWQPAGAADIDIAVTDGGAPTIPHQMEPSVIDEEGRGLSIVETLSNRWWLETTPARSTVHALIHLT